MEKGTNTSKCRDLELGCSIAPSRYLVTGGYALMFDVHLFNFEMSKREIAAICSRLNAVLKSEMNRVIADRSSKDPQLDLFVDTLGVFKNDDYHGDF